MINGNLSLRLRASLITMCLVFTACETPINERILEIETGGAVLVFLYRDDNVNGAFNAGSDVPVADARFALRMRGAETDDFTTQTDTAGFGMAQVPPGRYTLKVDDSVLGDSLELTAGGTEFTVATTDTVRQNVGIAYITVTPSEARVTPLGRRVWLNGVALNAPASFGDSTVHVTDGQRSIRAFAVRPAGFVAGDSVLFLGRLTQVDGQPVLEVNTQIQRGQQVTVVPDSISTGSAADAAGGALDAALVRIFNAVIGDTATDPAGNRVFTVDDGSGPVRMVLSRNRTWSPINQFVIGATIEGTGVLAPDPAQTSVWVLKPRARTDLLVF